MPLPILLAHGSPRASPTIGAAGHFDWLRPDAKSQVSLVYEGNTPVRRLQRPHLHAARRQHRPGRDRATTSRRCSRRACSASGSRPDAEVIVNPSGSFVLRRPVGRLRRHRPQDHRRLVRRRRPSRRRRVQRQGPVEGRPQRRLLLPLRRAPHRPGRAGQEGRSAGGVRHRPRQADVDQGRHVRHGRRGARPRSSSTTTSTSARRTSSRSWTLLQPIYRKTTNYGHFGKAGLPWEKPVPVAV